MGKTIAEVSVSDTAPICDDEIKVKDEFFSKFKYKNLEIATTPLKKMYTDCFNSECVDLNYIGDLLPRLIVFPEGNNLLRMKIAAASSAFALTWNEPVRIEKDEDDDDDDDDDDGPDNFN